MNKTDHHRLKQGLSGCFFLLVLFLLSGCSQIPVAAAPAQPAAKTGIAPTETVVFFPSFTPTHEEKSVNATQTVVPTVPPMVKNTPTRSPDQWQDFPIIPMISKNTRGIYERGLGKNRNPHAFSKVGDCESRTTWFMADFDMGSQYYSLGAYEYLQTEIDYFSGSFGRLSQVAKPGFTAASLMTPLWADPKVCQKSETPLACEYRQQNPSFALVMLGTNDVARPETFETNMRSVIEFTIAQGIVPILVTKADNLEGDHSINRTIVRLAVEYDIPLWNFWAAVQSLPDHGLQEDGAHLTWSPNNFGDSQAMLRAWPVRNLNALQVLAALRKGVQE